MKIEELAASRGYKALPDGSVLSSRGKILRLRLNKEGYLYFGLKVASYKVRSVLVHRLVAYQKFGLALFEPGIETRHKDNNAKNNRDDNILIGTPSENNMDKKPEVRLRTSLVASKANRKYDHAAVAQFYRECSSYTKTMKKFGIASKGTIANIMARSRAIPSGTQFEMAI